MFFFPFFRKLLGFSGRDLILTCIQDCFQGKTGKEFGQNFYSCGMKHMRHLSDWKSGKLLKNCVQIVQRYLNVFRGNTFAQEKTSPDW